MIKDGSCEQDVAENIKGSEAEQLHNQVSGNWNATDDLVADVKGLQIRKDEGDHGKERSRNPTSSMLQPILTRDRFEMATQINHGHGRDRKNVRGGEGGNAERGCGENGGFGQNKHESGD